MALTPLILLPGLLCDQALWAPTMALLTEMRTQSIANIAWSCSVLEYTPVRLCAALSKEVVSRRVVWGLGVSFSRGGYGGQA